MPSTIKAVLFDYGLVLTGPPLPAAWVAMQKALRSAESAFAAAYWKFRLDYDRGTLGGEPYWRAVAGELGQSPAEPELARLVALDTQLWTVVNQPMVDWALRLRAAGTRTGILSNLGDCMMDGVLEQLDWMHGFDHSTFSHTLNLVKPDPAIYRHAAEGLRVRPEHILFVDDREENIRGAEAAGLQAIQYGHHDAFVVEMYRRELAILWEQGRP